MKLALVLALMFSSAAFAQDAYYKEHCESNATATNLKTGEVFTGDQMKLLTGADLIEWLDGDKMFKLTLENTTLPEGQFPMIQQVVRITEKGPQPDQTIANIALKDFTIQDYKVKIKTMTAKLLVTVKSPTESVSTDIGVGTTAPKLPDESLVTSNGPLGAVTTTQTQLAPSINGDYRTDSSVSVCTDTPVTAKDVSFPGFFSGVKTPIAIFTKQHTATMTAKKALTDCQAKPDPKDCSALAKKYQASSKNRDDLWTTVVKAGNLPVPKKPKPDDGGSTVEVPGDNSCGFSSQCPADEACINNKCQAGQCKQRSDCFPNQSCVNGSCEGNNGQGCSSSGDCIGGEQCVRGVCTSDTSKGGCHWDSDCQEGQRCNAANFCE